MSDTDDVKQKKQMMRKNASPNYKKSQTKEVKGKAMWLHLHTVHEVRAKLWRVKVRE